ncbi:DUF2971 domain-containing protein [Vibrio sp. 11-4(1)]|uniref:DUF2971 domain-containing protein n=1 Tax=Vibrio sp. 11-4(1) TaxID=2591018 RepID=UPI0020183DBE|nr:DUF2971 domain-containing protein [Vibrio sp. 11-4(1)]
MNGRLYAAPYTDMNDPMEGHYFQRSGRLSSEFKSALKGEKRSYGIVSLSEIADNTLMWAHYANGHNGIAIGVEIDSDTYDIRKIEYDGLSQLTQSFSHKLEVWDYEKEYRVFVQHEKYVNVKIKEVIFERRVEHSEREFFEKLFTKLAGNNIEFSQEQRT